MKDLRAVLDSYNARMSVAEIFSAAFQERSIEYTTGQDRLHTAYNFFFITARRLTPSLVRSALSAWQGVDAWPSWSFSNHDTMRAVTRWGGDTPTADLAKLLNVLLLSLRGTAFLYQGEELGMTQGEVPFERLQDPFAKALWPELPIRDGARTPMAWAKGAQHSGFSSAADTWLPTDPRHAEMAADVQEEEPHSVLNVTRRFLAFRKRRAELISGDLEFVDLPDPVLAFERRLDATRTLCVFNLADTASVAELPERLAGLTLMPGSGSTGCVDGRLLHLPARGFAFLD